jgi:murein DD-endopeptidase MepM/ murein hydrolase activator NlpD
MAKVKYRFNPHTLSFDVIAIPFYKKFAKIAIHFFSYALIFVVLGFGFSFFVDTPDEQALKRTNAELLLKYNLTIKKMEGVNNLLASLQNRDNNIYRAIFESDSIPASIRLGGYGGTDRYKNLEDLINAKVVITLYQLLDKIAWRAYIQSKSFDEVIHLAKNKERLIQCKPAIQPISVRDLVRVSDYFGYRTDPYTKQKGMHYGIDFAGPVGTPVYGTGDGVVVEAGYAFNGYGNQVVIDHGFGYKSRYAHLHKVSVKEGQSVKRGELVGTLGNSGRSTGPHLHYEVLLHNNPLNPLNYFDDLTEEDYERMIQGTLQGNFQSLD